MKKKWILGVVLFGLTTSIGSQNQIDHSLNKAQWIISNSQQTSSVEGTAMPRKVFHLKKKTGKAILTATALGIYDVTVNGYPVGQHELKPGWTDYRKEVTSQTMDITALLRKGENEILVQLSSGWWNGSISRGVYGGYTPMAFKAILDMDGQTIALTDETWQCSHDGPLLSGDIYDGEVYDARRIPTNWKGVRTLTDMSMNVIPFEGPEVRIRDKKLWRHPQSITLYSDTIKTETEFGMIKPNCQLGDESFILHKGETAVVDLGQNMVGWIHFEAKAKAGTTDFETAFVSIVKEDAV